MTIRLTNRDTVALALAAGIKLGGGSYGQAFVWGFVARIAMKYLGFPQEQCLSAPAQSFVEDLSQLWRRTIGTPAEEPQQMQPPAPGNGAEGYSQNEVIDVEYQEYGT